MSGSVTSITVPANLASPAQISGSCDPLCRAKRGSASRSRTLGDLGIEPNASSPSMKRASIPLMRGEPSERTVAIVLCTRWSISPLASAANSGSVASICDQEATYPPSSALTIALTSLPSAAPPNVAIAAFITAPMSLGLVAPNSAMVAATTGSIAAASSCCGR